MEALKIPAKSGSLRVLHLENNLEFKKSGYESFYELISTCDYLQDLDISELIPRRKHQYMIIDTIIKSKCAKTLANFTWNGDIKSDQDLENILDKVYDEIENFKNLKMLSFVEGIHSKTQRNIWR